MRTTTTTETTITTTGEGERMWQAHLERHAAMREARVAEQMRPENRERAREASQRQHDEWLRQMDARPPVRIWEQSTPETVTVHRRRDGSIAELIAAHYRATHDVPEGATVIAETVTGPLGSMAGTATAQGDDGFHGAHGRDPSGARIYVVKPGQSRMFTAPESGKYWYADDVDD